MAATVKNHPAKPARRRGKAPWLRGAGLLLGALLAAATAWLIWQQYRQSHRPVADVAIPEPPALDLAGADPAVLRAIETAQAAVQESPHSPQAWALLGKVLLAHEFYLPANTCLAQAERLDPAEPRWPYLQGIALLYADPPDPVTAIVHFQRAVECGGDMPNVLRLRLGETLLGQDRLEEAEQQFQRILALDAANARAHLGLARLAMRRGDLQMSRMQVERTLGDPHAKKASRLLLAEVQQRLGQEVSAEELRQVAQMPDDPAWPDSFWEEAARLRTGLKTHLSRAEMWFRQNRVPEALRLVQQSVRDYPDSHYAWLMLGRILIRQRSLTNAEQALRRALKLAPDSAEVQFHLGVALYLQGNYRAAEELFRSAIETKPNFAMAHHNLGHCLLHRGDRAGAIEEFRTALRCKPDYVDAHTMLSDMLASSGQHAEAFAHARLALQFSPTDENAKKLLRRLWMQIPIPVGP